LICYKITLSKPDKYVFLWFVEKVIIERKSLDKERKDCMTENKGFLKTWKDDRGFGFIKPEDGSDDVFIHISALEGFIRRPHRGDTIFYQIEHGEDGKSKAVNASIEGVEKFSDQEVAGNKWLWITAVLLGLVSAAAAAYYGMQ